MDQNSETIRKKELTHQYREMDMLATVYEKLQRKYRFRSRCLDCMLILSSLIFFFLILVDPQLLGLLQLTQEQEWFLLRLNSVLILALAILTFTIDWKAKAAIFHQAMEMLTVIKTDCKEMLKLEAQEQMKIFQVKSIEYNAIINRLPAIPEQYFNKLKTYHKRRLELNRMLESFPGSSVWLLRFFIFCRANLHLLLRKPFMNRPVEENS